MTMRNTPKSPFDNQDFVRFYLWRHPETVGARAGKFWGHSDVDLSRTGLQQAKAMVRHMSESKVQAIYCSDLKRTRRVAEAMGRAQHPRRKIEVLSQLRELNLGIWEGMTFGEIAKRYPGDLNARSQDLVNFRITNGESLDDLSQRVLPVWDRLVKRHMGENVCVVCHAGVVRVILTHVLGAPLSRLFRLGQDYACLNVVEIYSDGVPVVKMVNFPVEVL